MAHRWGRQPRHGSVKLRGSKTRRVQVGWLTVLGFFLLGQPAIAIDGVVRAPLECSAASSCDFDIALSMARQRADQVSSRLRGCNTASQKPDCNLAPAVTEPGPCERGAGSSRGDWAYPTDIASGQAAMELLLRRLQSGRPFSPISRPGRDQLLVVEGNTALTPGERRIALCTVRTVENTAGPPRDCTTVAIMSPAVTVMRVALADARCSALARTRPGGTIEVMYSVQTQLPVGPFADAIGQLLRDELSVSMERRQFKGSGTVTAIIFQSTSGLRNSKIVEGWREAFDIDITIGIPRSKIVDIQVNLFPRVVQFASGDITDYHSPNAAQAQQYQATLDNLVSRAIVVVCKNYKKADDRNVVC